MSFYLLLIEKASRVDDKDYRYVFNLSENFSL